MKYLIRSVKYFIYLTVVLTIVIFALVQFKVVEGDISKMFVNGYDSLWQIALIIAGFAALYPRFGYTHRLAPCLGDAEEADKVLAKIMEDHGYKLSSENPDKDVRLYVKRSPALRALKLGEDRITVTRTLGGFDIEGPTKDIIRLVSAFEGRAGNTSGE